MLPVYLKSVKDLISQKRQGKADYHIKNLFFGHFSLKKNNIQAAVAIPLAKACDYIRKKLLKDDKLSSRACLESNEIIIR